MKENKRNRNYTSLKSEILFPVSLFHWFTPLNRNWISFLYCLAVTHSCGQPHHVTNRVEKEIKFG